MSWKISIPLLIFSALLASCGSTNPSTLFQTSHLVAVDTLQQVVVTNDALKGPASYILQPGDILSIRNLRSDRYVGGKEESAQEPVVSLRIEQDGSILLPAMGRVNVGGLTKKEAASAIERLYSETLLKDPLIDLQVTNLKVTVLGEFTRQGNYLLEKENTSLIEIIGEAGGITENANPKALRIIRGDRANPEIIHVNLQNLNSLTSPKLLLKNNDIIYLEPSKLAANTKRIQGFSTYLQPVLVVLNTALIIYNLTR